MALPGRISHARLAEARGQHEAAAAAAGEALRLARSYEPSPVRVGLAPHVARIALAAGAREQAEDAAAAADEAANALGTSTRRGCALLIRGLLTEDADVLLAAVEQLRGAPRPLERALALESAAALLGRDGRDAEARAFAVETLVLYGEIGAPAEEARASLRLRELGLRLGVRGRRGRPRFGWESLTEAELRVVRLVAEGHTDPQIAERLYLTHHTVRAHVSSALRKLGLSSRTELAAEVARRGV